MPGQAGHDTRKVVFTNPKPSTERGKANDHLPRNAPLADRPERNGLSPLDPAMAGVRLRARSRIASGRSRSAPSPPLPRFAGEGEGVAKEGEEGLRSAPRGAFLSRQARP